MNNEIPIWLIGIGIFLAVDFFIVAYVFWKKSRNSGLDEKTLRYIQSHWIRIIDMFPGNPKGAILDADKLLDYALARKGFEGSVGEKLKKAKGRFSDLNGVWVAHKLRNKVAHELGDIDMKVGKRALGHFKRALNDLGARL